MYDTKCIVKMPNKLKNDAQKQAKLIGLNLSAYIRLLISQDLKSDQR